MPWEVQVVKIQVLGTGCPKCKKLAQNAEQAIAATGVDAEVEKIDQIADIVAFGVMITPALAIDGDLKVSGKVLSAEQIQELIEGE